MSPRSPLTLLLLGLPLAASAQVVPHVVNGAGELGEPTSVGLVQGDPPQDGRIVCSGVLIGCDVAITTAHCFNSNSAEKTHLFVPHAGFLAIESATRHPAYVEAITQQPPGWIDTTREDDIAFVKLAAPLAGLTPAWADVDPDLSPGTPGLVVGFGRDPVTETGVQNPGIKRSGSVALGPCDEPPLAGLDLLCWSPDESPSPPGEDVSTCTGDSGGPLFTDDGGTRLVSGITKGAIWDPQGQPDLCEPPVHPYDVRVGRHLDWIGGADGAGGMVAASGAVPLDVGQCGPAVQLPELLSAANACSPDPFQPGSPARSCGFQGVLGGAGPGSADYSFPVPANTATLRVALNGVAASSGIDSDLYVRAGAPATPALHHCGADTDGTLGFCEWSTPAPGTWYAHVDQALGEGEHQVVVTLLGPTPGAPTPAPPPGATTGVAGLALATGWLLRRRIPAG